MAELLGHMRKHEFDEAAEVDDKLNEQIDDFQAAARARMAAKVRAAGGS
jgi:hypothetical protein